MSQAYYSASFEQFLSDEDFKIRDTLTEGGNEAGFYDQIHSQTESWKHEIKILKKVAQKINQHLHSDNCSILLEYPIPLRAKRIDVVLLIKDLIFVIEFKNSDELSKANVAQLEDYCLDLRDFHFESRDKIIVPILLNPLTKAKKKKIFELIDGIAVTQFANAENLAETILESTNLWNTTATKLDMEIWQKSKYAPTPTIIQAAQALYANHEIKEIVSHHSDAENLTKTTKVVLDAIAEAQRNNSKIICFITGVPGAGKTLAGLNIIHARDFTISDEELGVFLSGNSPLVKVLTEALGRDASEREGLTKKEALRRVSTFIKNVHLFIDEYLPSPDIPPTHNVLVYDEAQRAWSKEHKKRKSKGKIQMSEPEILLSIMDRLKKSWGVIVALIGGGQEINTGEGGLKEWGKALENFPHWKIYLPPSLEDGDHSTADITLFDEVPNNILIESKPNLHLNVSIRSYKANQLSKWVNLLLQNKHEDAKQVFIKHLANYPIVLTRSLESAKLFLNQRLRGTKRCGIIASSGSKRLRAIGIDINGGLKGTSDQNSLGSWYLNDASDIRSSNFLEVIGSEFAVQGLELDWTCLCWDADLRIENGQWISKRFEGNRWKSTKDEQKQQFALNKYRVLLTRAREGMILFIPEGDTKDKTRPPSIYNSIFEYLQSCGIPEIF